MKSGLMDAPDLTFLVLQTKGMLQDYLYGEVAVSHGCFGEMESIWRIAIRAFPLSPCGLHRSVKSPLAELTAN